MSSDPIADLVGSLDKFVRALRALLNANKLPAPGSPADIEASQEAYAGEWGDHPSRDVYSTVLLTAWSCADHLAGMAAVMRDRCGVASLYTLVRAAAESAATACYLTSTRIDALERIRRNMNCVLDGLCQHVALISSFTVPEAQAQLAHNQARIAAIGRAGEQHGFQFKKQDRWRSAYFGKKPPPSAMTLMDECASRTPGLGATYQRFLSGVAHAKLHGLSRFLMSYSQMESRQPGQVLVQLNVRTGELAQHLLVGPLCAATLVEHLHWFARWDTDEVSPLVVRMLHTWGRIAGVPYTGPELR